MRIGIHAARQRVADLTKQLENLLGKAKAEGRDLTRIEDADWKSLMIKKKTAEAEVLAAEQELERERGMPAVDDENSVAARRAIRIFTVGGDGAHASRPGRGRSYRALFGKDLSANGFHSLEEFAAAVDYSPKVFDPRLKASATEANPTQAGFLVPEEFSAQILDQALEDAICLRGCQIWPMKSDVIKVPGVDDRDHSSSVLYGGVSANWADELGTLQDANIKTRLVQLNARKLGMLSQASNELIEDSSFEAVLTAKLQEAAQWHLDMAFFFGDGSNKPLGMLTAANPALVTVSKESSQPTDEIVYENVTKMYSVMAPRCRQRATWIMSDGLIPSCFKMQNRVTNLAGSEVVGGSGVSVFQMNADGSGTLLGRPVVFTEKVSAPGDLYDCNFVDLTQYAIGLRRDIRLEKSIHAGFSQDSSFWRLTCRVDGQPCWNSTLKLKNNRVVSPFVTLQAR